MVDREYDNDLMDKRPIKLERTDLEISIEAIFGDTIERVAEMDRRLKDVEINVGGLPEMKLLLSSMASSQSLMAQSAQSMADTFKRAEERADKQEERYDLLAQTAVGKDQIPLKSHREILISALLPTVLISFMLVVGTLYYTNSKIEASFSAVQIGQRETQAAVKKTEEKISQVASEVNSDANVRTGKENATAK